MLTFDANILFYAGDTRDVRKQQRAQAVLQAAREQGRAFVTLQCLAEFTAAITRMGLLDRADAAGFARDCAASFDVVCASAEELEIALNWFAAKRFSLWDGLLVATAVRGGATALVSEDLAGGTLVEGVEIVDPFKAGADSRLARHGLIL